MPAPIEDPNNVDARRASVGLDTFEEYRKVMLKVNEVTLTRRTSEC